jgi:hypothetical protein
LLLLLSLAQLDADSSMAVPADAVDPHIESELLVYADEIGEIIR